jgi:hypothetical protein
VLKLDWDWLSGASLYGQERLWFPQWLVPVSCVYVLVLEMALIWGLYSRRNWVFSGTLAQLFLFHLTSWSIVGFFYPTLMFCILAILPLTRLLHPPREWVTVPWRDPGARRLRSASVMALFGFFQLVPHAFPGDTAVTGEGRVFALHMFDALIECEAHITYRLDDSGSRQDTLDQTKRMPHRSRCDPLIYFAIAKNQCAHIEAQGAKPGGAVDLDLMLRSKRTTAPEYHAVIDIANFCASDPRYNIFRHNAWIRIPS